MKQVEVHPLNLHIIFKVCEKALVEQVNKRLGMTQAL